MRTCNGNAPLAGRVPAHAEWVLLRTLADDLKPLVDHNEWKLMCDIAEKRDFPRYLTLGQYWGLQSIDPRTVASTLQRDAALYLYCSFLAKWRFNEAGLVPVTVATFLEYERHCREYNRSGYRNLSWSSDPEVQEWFGKMQEFIASVLSHDVPSRAVQKSARHGPGRTFGLSSKYGNRFYKYQKLPYEVTAECMPAARAAIASDERWRNAIEDHFGREFAQIEASDLFRVVPGNLVMFVPKDSKTLRTIACEPAMNVYLQLGVDGYIRSRLKSFGVDIDSQALNQELARRGSLDNSIATLDLKGASDTISLAVIDKLFPMSWVQYLHDLRSSVGFMPDGQQLRYEKLSSMGNGYTFAVETLVFAAAVYAVGGRLGHDSHVYGDDIALPASLAVSLTKLLHCCGFMLNAHKSFADETHTRESCGKDYSSGINIRPVFLKDPICDSNIFTILALHNKLMAWWHQFGDINVPAVCKKIEDWVPPHFRCYGPPDPADLSSYLVSQSFSVRKHHYGYPFDRVIAVAGDISTCGDSDLFRSLLHDLADCDSDEGTRFLVTRRGDYRVAVKRGTSYCWTWPTTFDVR